jgi:hypothetical protein
VTAAPDRLGGFVSASACHTDFLVLTNRLFEQCPMMSGSVERISMGGSVLLDTRGNAMQLYIFWASLSLGLMRLSAEPWWQEQQCKPTKAIKQPHLAQRT